MRPHLYRRQPRAPRRVHSLRRPRGPELLEALESRVLLSTFSDSDVIGLWICAATGAQGYLQCDGAGGITGGSLHRGDGSTITPSGTYSVAADGAITSQSNIPYNSASGQRMGGINSSGDVVVLGNGADDHPLSVLISGGSATFASADLVGTWTLAFNSDDAGGNGEGTLSFDSLGGIHGSVRTGRGSATILAGDYTVSPGGLCTVDVTVPGDTGPQNLSLHGALNASKDFLALSPPNIATALSAGDSNLMVLVRSSGRYTVADLAGTWFIANDGISGHLALDGAGHITGGALDNDPGTTLYGSYSITPAGKVTLAVTELSGNHTDSFSRTGTLNAGRNAIISNLVGSSRADNLSVFVCPNHAPTLTAINSTTLGTAIGGKPLDITYGDLRAAADESDADGDSVEFDITDIGTGTLNLNSIPIQSSDMHVGPGDILQWTPASAGNGMVTAFSVRVSDGTLSSSKDIAVKIKTAPQAVVSIVRTRNGSETLGGGKGAGAFTVTRKNGDLTKDLIVNYTVDAASTAVAGTDYTALSGSITIPANKASAVITVPVLDDALAQSAQTLTLDLAPDSEYALDPAPPKQWASISIVDNESAVSIVRTKNGSETNGSSTGAAGFTVSRKGGDMTPALTVYYSIDAGSTAGANSDYPALSGNVVIPAGKTSMPIPVPVVDDSLAEDTEALTLNLTADPGYNLDVAPPKRTASVTITDNEPTVSVVASKPKASELNGSTTGMGQFTLTRTGGSLAGSLIVHFTVSGTAESKFDYTLSSSIATFDAGKSTTTINVNVEDDLTVEGTEYVGLTLDPDTAYRINTARSYATVSIADHNRPLVVGTPVPLTGALTSSAFSFSYNDLRSAVAVTDPENYALTFKVVRIITGGLRKNTDLSAPKTINPGDTLYWSSPNAPGTYAAFVLTALDGVYTTAPITVRIVVSA